ncbi:MAG: serine hydrolase [Planctomycetota bacterium]
MFMRALSFLVAVLLVLNCHLNEAAAKLFDDGLRVQVPDETANQVWPDESWPVSTAEEQGIEQAAIDQLVADIESGKYGLLDHFLLIRNGYIVADHHFEYDYEEIASEFDPTNHQYNYDHPAWHPYYDGSELHSLQSVTKSVLSAAVGIAIAGGHLNGTTEKVLPYFEDYEFDRSDERKGKITLADLLTMRSGIRWGTDAAYGTGEHSTDLLEASDEWIQFILDQPMDADPGTVFEYNDGASVLIGKVLSEATGKRADLWADERLFSPIGIGEFYWKITPDGEVDTEGGLYLKPHDLARIGLLFSRNGMWRDQQVIPESWVQKSTSPIIPDLAPGNDDFDRGYGYQWWIHQHDGERSTVYSASGYGGQFLQVVPGKNIIVVFNAWNIHGGQEMSHQLALEQRILPAVKDE